MMRWDKIEGVVEASYDYKAINVPEIPDNSVIVKMHTCIENMKRIRKRKG